MSHQPFHHVPQSPLPHPAVWRGTALHQAPAATMSSSFRLLDRELPGGGWPRGSLIELLVRHPGIGELRFLAPTLQQITRQGRNVILLAPTHLPHAPAFAAMGIDHTRILIVHARQPADRLWAVEQSIKSNSFGALITWLDSPGIRPDLLRRLQLAAASAQGLFFVFRPFSAQQQASPAPLRMLLLPRRYPDLAVQIIKRRGPVMSAAIDIPTPIPGSGLRPLDTHDAIVVPHAVDRMRHRAALPAAVSAAAAIGRAAARR
jgi:protein ImuA